MLGALDMARRKGAARIALACVPRPALAGHADVLVVVNTGPEAISGSTRMKAGTAQKLVLNAFSTALMVRLGKVYGNLMVDVQVTNEKLRRRAIRLVQQVAQVDRPAAARALAAADDDLKTAIVTLRLGVSVAEARVRLERAGGLLRQVLERS